MSTGSITVYPGTAESFSVELDDSGFLLIGRKPDPQGRIKLILPVPEVSGQHAEIRLTPDGWTIRDSGSTNGTRLNGERLAPGREYLIRNGDRITVAQVDLLVNLSEEAPYRRKEQQRDTAEQTHLRIQLITATILVADIKAFTTLMEAHAHNPLIVMQATQRLFEALSQEITKNTGHLEKIAGDAIMAYWHGDESQLNNDLPVYQACYTALRLRALAASLGQNQAFWPFRDYPLHLDMALATGPVAAGALAHKEANPALLGDTANLAFRLEKLIGEDAPGDILVDGATYLLVKSYFKFVALGQVNVKGRQRPVDIYYLVDLLEMPSVDTIH